jgi:hypothetical protein
MEKFGTPTVSGVKESMIDYGIGFGGGLLYAISTAIFGSGIIGGLAGAGIAGSVVKGVKGEIIATVLGFQTAISAFSAPSNSSANTRAIM